MTVLQYERSLKPLGRYGPAYANKNIFNLSRGCRGCRAWGGVRQPAIALIGGSHRQNGHCGAMAPALTRPQVAAEDLLKLRTTADEQSVAARELLGRLLERTKAEYDRYTASGRKEPPVIDILIISGGGDWGAFGAGFLKGWQKVPAQHPLAKPEFDAVTGVSTGTLIAPFAFLGRRAVDRRRS